MGSPLLQAIQLKLGGSLSAAEVPGLAGLYCVIEGKIRQMQEPLLTAQWIWSLFQA